MLPLRVLILFNEPILPPDHPDRESEREVLDIVEFVHGELAKAGIEVSRLGLVDQPALLIQALAEHRPDVVFNLFEGIPGRGETEAHVAGLMEWMRVPYTGSPFAALALARNKILTKLLLRGAGLPTPDFLAIDSLPAPECHLGWPVIIKPAEQDASVGLDQDSVVTNQQAYEKQVVRVLERHGPPVLVEQFIQGREFNVAMIDDPAPRALPISEILFLRKTPGIWPIVTYDAKWAYESDECVLTPPQCPADIDPDLAQRLETIAVRAFRLLGCRDYVRLDFRVSVSGQPYLLEVNTNPDFSPDAGFSRSLKAAGIDHEQLAVDLARRAAKRGGDSTRQGRL